MAPTKGVKAQLIDLLAERLVPAAMYGSTIGVLWPLDEDAHYLSMGARTMLPHSVQEPS